MHILFLSHYFPPEVNAPASRTAELCRRWVAAGHKVTVVTCVPNHPKGEVYPGFRNSLFDRSSIDGIEIIRVWTFLAANEGFLRRTLNYVSYLGSVILQMKRLPKADVVISTSPQFFCGLAGWFVSRAKGAAWILEIRDLWPESIVAVGAMKRSVVIRGLEALERLAYQKADGIVAVSRSFVAHFQKSGITSDKVDIVPNGVNLELFDVDASGAEFRSAHDFGDRFVAAYVGTHGMAQKLDTVLEAAALLAHRPDVMFLLVGEGAERERLLAKREAMGLNNVIMLPQLPRELMPQVMAAVDAAIVPLRRLPLFKDAFPSKIFEAMAMQKPILIGVEGEAGDVVERARCGLSFVPEDASDLARAVGGLALDRDAAQQLGVNGRTFVAVTYDRSILADQYLDIIQRVLRRTVATGRARQFHSRDAIRKIGE